MHGTMKAARLHGFERTHGSSEVVRVDDVPSPDLATGEVLIRVLRAGLNHGDLHMREDAVQYSPEVKTVPDLPMTIGHDGLGQIVEVGPDVENFALATASWSCVRSPAVFASFAAPTASIFVWRIG